MSKGKNASVEKKKAPGEGPKKEPSAYQSSKKTVSKIENSSNNNKKKS